MILQPTFTQKELEDIAEGLRMAAIHSNAPGESERWSLLGQRISVVVAMNKSLKVN